MTAVVRDAIVTISYVAYRSFMQRFCDSSIVGLAPKNAHGPQNTAHSG